MVFRGALNSGNSNLISISDADMDAQMVTVTVTNGGLFSLDASDIGVLTFFTGVGTDDATMTFSGTFAQVNAALDGSSFNPNSTVAIHTIDVDTDDGDATDGPETITVTVTAANTNPTEANNNGLTLNEGVSANIPMSELEFTDAEQAAAAITYTITTTAVSNGVLFLDEGDMVFGAGDTDVSTLTSTFTQADINGGILYYEHDGTETTGDSFGFDVDDGAGGSVTGETFNITVTTVNDDPSTSVALLASITVLEDETLGDVDITSINLVDDDLMAADLIVTLSVTGANRLRAATGGSVTANPDDSDAVSLTLTGTLANLNTYLDNTSSVRYTHGTADANGNASETLSIQADDGGNTGTVPGNSPVTLGMIPIKGISKNSIKI